MEFPDDIYELIILHTDIDYIYNMSLINISINKICNNKHVWIQKFEKNNLPIIQSNCKRWIDEYKRVNFSKFYSHHVIDLILQESESDGASLTIDFKMTDDIVYLLPQSLISKIILDKNYSNLKTYGDTQTLFIYIDERDVMLSYYVRFVENNPKLIYISNAYYIDIIEFKSLLFNLLYHFPHIDITDDSECSYLKPNDLSKFVQYKKYTKILMKRADFWKKIEWIK